MDATALAENRLKGLEQWPDQLRGIQELVLANAVMMGEVPAPTFGESDRIRFLCDRFREEGLDRISTDEAGNGSALLPGKKSDRTILVVAHADTVFNASVDHSMAVSQDSMTGPGIADNSLGLAAVASLPSLLERLGIELDANLLLLGAARSLGKGDLEGIRFFLDHYRKPIHGAVCVEGTQLGRLSYKALGMYRGELHVEVPEALEWEQFNTGNALLPMQRIMQNLLAIPLPQLPRAVINIGSISAGTAYNTPPTDATLRFEIRCEEPGVVGQVLNRVETIVDEINLEGQAKVELKAVARRKPGGLKFEHPLVRAMRSIQERLEIKPRLGTSTGELTALIDRAIPAVTLGLTRGESVHDFDETVKIAPLFRGLSQLVALITAIDSGACDEED